MSAPAHVLLARAMHSLEGARLHLEAGNTEAAIAPLEAGIALIREVLET